MRNRSVGGLGEFIRSRRLELGIAQKELAHQIGRTPSVVARWENHRGHGWLPNATILAALSETLHVSVSDLVAASQSFQIDRIDHPHVTTSVALASVRAAIVDAHLPKTYAHVLQAVVDLAQECEQLQQRLDQQAEYPRTREQIY